MRIFTLLFFLSISGPLMCMDHEWGRGMPDVYQGLIKDIKEGNSASIRAKLEKGVEKGVPQEYSYQDERGCFISQTLIRFAIEFKRPDLIPLFLEYGASITFSYPNDCTLFHVVAEQTDENERKALVSSLVTSPHGSPPCTQAQYKEACDRIFTALCCFKRLQKQLVLPCAIPKDVRFHLISFLPEDVRRTPFGLYWKRYRPEHIISLVPFIVQARLVSEYTVDTEKKQKMGPVLSKEKRKHLVKTHVARHLKRLKTMLLKADTVNDGAVIGETPMEEAVRLGYQDVVPLLDPEKVANHTEVIGKEYESLLLKIGKHE